MSLLIKCAGRGIYLSWTRQHYKVLRKLGGVTGGTGNDGDSDGNAQEAKPQKGKRKTAKDGADCDDEAEAPGPKKPAPKKRAGKKTDATKVKQEQGDDEDAAEVESGCVNSITDFLERH